MAAPAVTFGRPAASRRRRRLLAGRETAMTTFHPAGITPADDATELRELAITRLHKKRDLQAHLLAYLLVNLLLNGIWFLTGPDSFYWPIIPMLGWGIGVAFHIWDVYAPETPSEERIRREMDRLSRPQ
jgi:hypothetical protein